MTLAVFLRTGFGFTAVFFSLAFLGEVLSTSKRVFSQSSMVSTRRSPVDIVEGVGLACLISFFLVLVLDWEVFLRTGLAGELAAVGAASSITIGFFSSPTEMLSEAPMSDIMGVNTRSGSPKVFFLVAKVLFGLRVVFFGMAFSSAAFADLLVSLVLAGNFTLEILDLPSLVLVAAFFGATSS